MLPVDYRRVYCFVAAIFSFNTVHVVVDMEPRNRRKPLGALVSFSAYDRMFREFPSTLDLPRPRRVFGSRPRARTAATEQIGIFVLVLRIICTH